MTYEEYTAAIAKINEELQRIADITEGQALVGTADFSNPRFVNLMKQHVLLTKLSSNLSDRMMNP